jgi:hypothetical protein
MSAKKTTAVKPQSPKDNPPSTVRPWMVAGTAAGPLDSASRKAAPAPDLLLVCLQDPFEAVGDSSTIVRTTVPTADGSSAHLWQLEAVMEMNPPRVFRGWATRGSFTLDLSVHASAFPATGTWGGTANTTSGPGNCRVIIMRDSNNKVRFSLASATRHAAEQPMPAPENRRFLNADIAFETNGASGLSAGAVAVVSNINWARLIAGSGAAASGMAFDGKWRHNLDPADGDASVAGAWAFTVMTRDAYEAFCANHGWMPYVL